jgi:membrane protease YdiL (CAAX protease family)
MFPERQKVLASAEMSALAPAPSDPATPSTEVDAQPPAVTILTPYRRGLALGLVLFISFAHFIASSVYYLRGGTPPVGPGQHSARLLSALIAEVGSLGVLWYVLSGQGRNWKDIGWNLEWMDLPRAVGLSFGSIIAGVLLLVAVQIPYHSIFGQYLAPKSLRPLFGFGISTLSIALVCLNPFFEELIVRGYLMSEIFDLHGGGVLAVLISVAVQMSYHLYQGLAHGIVLTGIFVVSSIYFWSTRRIAPVVLAHFFVDAYALLRGHF